MCGGRVEVDGVAGGNLMHGGAMLDGKRSGQYEEELAAEVLVAACLASRGGGQELGKVGVELAVRDKVAQALKKVAGVFDACLRQTDAVLAAVDAEECLGLGLKKVIEVLREDHGDAGEIAQRGDDTASLQLGEKAGGEAGVTAQLDKAHGFLEAEMLDALADLLLGDDRFGRRTVHLDGGDVHHGVQARAADGSWKGGRQSD